MSTPTGSTPTNETGAVLSTVAALETQWAAGDADAFAALHTEDASYVAFDGTVMRGRAEIAAGHRPLFDGIMKGSRWGVVHRDVRFISADIAVVVQRAGILMRWQKRRREPSKKRMSTNTTLLVREGGTWAIAAFQNTRFRPWSDTLVGRLMTRRTK